MEDIDYADVEDEAFEEIAGTELDETSAEFVDELVLLLKGLSAMFELN